MIPELEGVPPGEAVFDLDGTLVLGDLGEAVAGLADRNFPPPTYGALSSVDQALACMASLEGRRVAEVAELVDQAFDRGLVVVNEPVAALARALGDRHRVWILTGSPEVVAQMAAPRLGLAHVMGINVEWEGDRLGSRVIPPVPIDIGKVGMCWVRLGRRPVFAIGNSERDFPVLAHARVARTTGEVAGQRFPAFP